MCHRKTLVQPDAVIHTLKLKDNQKSKQQNLKPQRDRKKNVQKTAQAEWLPVGLSRVSSAKALVSVVRILNSGLPAHKGIYCQDR